MAIAFHMRPIVLPPYLIQHQYPAFRVIHGHRVIKDPVLSFLILHDLRVVSRADELMIFPDQHLVVVFHHGSALFIHIRAKKIFRATYHGGIGAVQSFAAGANGKQVIVPVLFVYIDSRRQYPQSAVGSGLDPIHLP